MTAIFPGSVRYHAGDVVLMRKPHPCGSYEWEITRTGTDFGLRCVLCGRRVVVPRSQFEKQVKKVVRYVVDAGGPHEPGGAPRTPTR